MATKKKTTRKKTAAAGTRKKATGKKVTKKKTTRKKVARKAPAKKRGTAKKTSARSGTIPAPAGSEEKSIVAELTRLRGKEGVIFGGQVLSEVTEVIPTGIFAIDNYVIGIGGLPVGRVVELAAEEGGGKTSLAISAIGQCQKEGGLAAYMDAEYSVSRERFDTFGADFDTCIFSQPATLEELVEDVNVVLQGINPKRGPNLIVVDSIAAAPTNRQLEGEIMKPGEVASIITANMKPMLKLLTQKRVCLLCINQIRENVNGGPFKPDTYTPGGRFFKHAASLRLHIWGGKKVVNDRERHIGKDVTFQAVKNRMSSPFKKARVRLMFKDGWLDDWSSMVLAKELDLIPKGSHRSAKTYELARQELEAELFKE